MAMLSTESLEPRTWMSDKELRRQIDRSITRALVDRDFESRLLSDPTLALGEGGCSPQQFKSVRAVRARDLADFARQVQTLFWFVDAAQWSLEELPLASGGG